MILSAKGFLFVFKKGRAKLASEKEKSHFSLSEQDTSSCSSPISASFWVVILTENEVPCCALTIELSLGGVFLFIKVFKWDSLSSTCFACQVNNLSAPSWYHLAVPTYPQFWEHFKCLKCAYNSGLPKSWILKTHLWNVPGYFGNVLDLKQVLQETAEI